jgi:hypothetical protein
VAVEDISGPFSITVFPNPTIGKFTISMDNVKWLMVNGNTSTINYQPPTIEIYNVMGEKVYQSIMTDPKSEIDLSSQPNGIYFLSVRIPEKVNSKKIIKL